MSTASVARTTAREPALLGQTAVVIGGSAGIGLETARSARAEGAEVILTGRNSDRLERAGTELGALSTATFDANDLAAPEAFFAHLEGPIDHVMVAAGGPGMAETWLLLPHLAWAITEPVVIGPPNGGSKT